MGDTQTVIHASTVASQIVAAQPARRWLYIRNYSISAETMWVAFGKTATPGNAGERELIPGGEYSWGGPLPPAQRNLPHGFPLPPVPTESISVITAAATAEGCIEVL